VAIQKLKEGAKAPSFQIIADNEKKLSLKDFKGEWLVLYFYPKDMTPGCTTEACEFQSRLKKFSKMQASVVGVSKDSVARHLKFKEKYSLEFPLLADESGELCESYGVWTQKSLYGKKFMGIERTTVLIDPKGKIAKIYPKVKVKGHVDQVLADLTELRKKQS